MTVFEQHVDLSQIATEPTLLGFALIIPIGLIVFLATLYLADKLTDNKCKTSTQSLYVMLIGFIVAVMAFFGSVLAIAALTGNNSTTAQPEMVKNIFSSNKPLLADKYREEINSGIADKLDGYTIDNVDLTNDSILTGGYLDNDVTAHHDGKNYLLHPETSFDKSTSTVTITIDVEQLPFDRTTKE